MDWLVSTLPFWLTLLAAKVICAICGFKLTPLAYWADCAARREEQRRSTPVYRYRHEHGWSNYP